MTPDPAAVLAPPIPHRRRPSWIVLRAADDSPATARRFTRHAARCYTLDDDAVYTASLVTSELVTNAVLHGCSLSAWGPRDCPIRLEVAACNRWIHIAVTDPDPRPVAALDVGGQLSEHGRGLSIISDEAALWWVVYAEHAKTVHAVVSLGARLTAAELAQIRDAR